MAISDSTAQRYTAQDPDVRLMLQVRDDNAVAFEELMQRYQSRLVSLMSHLVGRRDMAEDLAQDVFLRIYRARKRYVPGSKFSTWMYTIANNVASNALRGLARRKEVNLVGNDSGELGGNPLAAKALAASGLMPTRQLDKAELSEVVKIAVSALNERQRMAVLLNKFEHLSYEEIAAVMQQSPSAIKSLLSRARANLREVLEPYLEQGAKVSVVSTDPQQLERIVAYLDGELSAEESALVEQQLASDEQFRQELQGAERAWSALDELPMVHAGDDFSRTTMELVVDRARHDVEARTIALPIQQRQEKNTKYILAAIALLLGALVTRIVSQAPNRQLVADLPVIHNVDIYSQFRDLEFLRTLDRHLGHESKLSPADAEPMQAKLSLFQLVSATDSRLNWLEELSRDDQVTLRAKQNRFRALTPKRQDELRQLHAAIDQAKDRESLLLTMYGYQEWLADIPPSRQAESRGRPAQQRAAEVAREMRRAAYDQQFELSDNQLRKLFDEVGPYVRKAMLRHNGAIQGEVAGMSRSQRRDFAAMSRSEQFRRAFHLMLRESPEAMRQLNEIVLGVLPEDVGQLFQELPLGRKVEQMRAWTAQFHGAGRKAGQVSEEELADFFVDELNNAQKEELLAMPREQMRERLLWKLQGKRSQRDRRGPSEAERPPRRGGPPFDGPPFDGPRSDQLRDPEQWGPGQGPPPRGGPRFEAGPRRSPRENDRDFPPRRRRPQDRRPIEGGQ